MSLTRHKREPNPVNSPLLSQSEILELMHRAQQLGPLNSTKLVAHELTGENQSVYRGIGPEFEDSRQYQPGDELRHMNWRLSARSTGHYIKLFSEERRPGTFILLDRRSAMRFGTRVRLKVTQAARIATMLSFAARVNTLPIGAVILDSDTRSDNPSWLRETNSNADIHHLINLINRPCPPVSRLDEEPSLQDTLMLMLEMLTRGSNVILISDFIDLDNDCRTPLSQLSEEHRVQAIHIIDPAEPELPKAGKLRLMERPGQQSYSINTDDSAITNEYAIAAQQHLDMRQKIFSSLNIPCTPVLTNVNNIDDLFRSVY